MGYMVSFDDIVSNLSIATIEEQQMLVYMMT